MPLAHTQVPNYQADTVAIQRPKPAPDAKEPPKVPAPRRVAPAVDIRKPGPPPPSQAPRPFPPRPAPLRAQGPGSPPPPPPARAQPQHIPPRPAAAEPEKTGRSGKFRGALAAAAVLAAVLAVVLVVTFLLRGDPADTPEAKVRASIDTFTKALSAGDLAALKTSTCGALGDYYQKVDPAVFADVHKNAQQNKRIPVVRSVDAVQITKPGEAAIAQASVVFGSEPNNTLARTFDLADTGEGWKVCSAPH